MAQIMTAFPKRPGPSHARGFSLIELMIVVAIVAILTAIAVPGYQEYVKRARRSDAEGALLGLAQIMERYYSDNNVYPSSSQVLGSTAGSALLYPSWAPTDKAYADRVYNITIPSSSTFNYTLRATPVTGQLMATDGYLELNSAGQKRWDKNNNGSIGSDENTWDQ